jgi:hypothetical protein
MWIVWSFVVAGCGLAGYLIGRNHCDPRVFEIIDDTHPAFFNSQPYAQGYEHGRKAGYLQAKNDLKRRINALDLDQPPTLKLHDPA